MKAVFFDLDGTLTDPAEGITGSIRYALEKLGLPAPEPRELHWCIGPSLRQSFTTLLNGDAARAEQAIILYRERFSETGLYENEVYPGVPEMLTILRGEGFALYVATSKPQTYAERIIQHFELSPFFRRVFGPGLDVRHMGKEDLLRQALSEEHLDAADCWMVGDRVFDIEGARACGLRNIGVLYGYGSRSELVQAGAEILVEHPEDIPPIIMKETGAA